MSPITKHAAPRPMNIGFLGTGAMVTSMVSPLLETPAAPMPAMARPAMKALLVGAQPQRRLPTRKTKVLEL